MARVLVTEAHLRHPLAIIRSLGRKGINVTGVDRSRVAPGFFSKYCKRNVVCTDPRKDSGRFVKEMLSEVRKGGYDVLMGLGHDTIFHISENRKLFEKYTRVPIVEHSKLLKANNKGEVMKLAKKLGVPIPKTYFIKNVTDAKKLEYPVIIKPVVGSGSRGVVLVKSFSEFVEKFNGVVSEFGECIVQDYIPAGGDAFGVSVLFDYDSKCKAIFTHKRLREYPISGGPSVLRESVSYPEIEKYSVKLMESLGWFGVAMLEFKVDPRDGKPKLMEINGRLWGSLPLAVNAGVDFPYLLYKLVMDGDVSRVDSYRLGVKCRWALPGDLLYFLSVREKLKFIPELFNFRGEEIYDDVIVFDDIGPVLGTLLFMVSSFFSKEMRKYIFRKSLV